MVYVTYQRMTFPLLGVIFAASLAGCFFDGRGVGASDVSARDLRVFDMPGSHDAAGDAEGGILPDGAHESSPAEGLLADVHVTDSRVLDHAVKDVVASPDVLVCPSICSNKCAGGVCEIDCKTTACTCPPKLPCRPLCGTGECHDKVDCSHATSCDVRCGYNACWGDVLCGTGDCSVTCEGIACHAKVDGSKAQKATITCGTNACWGDVLCGTGDCTVGCDTLACHTKVDGSKAQKATITCGTNACWGDVSCGTKECRVDCKTGACRNKVICDKACACSVNCHPGGCFQPVGCPAACQKKCAPNDGCDNC